jgi:hypothetical protein
VLDRQLCVIARTRVDCSAFSRRAQWAFNVLVRQEVAAVLVVAVSVWPSCAARGLDVAQALRVE